MPIPDDFFTLYIAIGFLDREESRDVADAALNRIKEALDTARAATLDEVIALCEGGDNDENSHVNIDWLVAKLREMKERK